MLVDAARCLEWCTTCRFERAVHVARPTGRSLREDGAAAENSSRAGTGCGRRRVGKMLIEDDAEEPLVPCGSRRLHVPLQVRVIACFRKQVCLQGLLDSLGYSARP